MAADTGWPPKVMPWVKDFVSCMKGSDTRSETITPPMAA